jgi:hypothetical protein
LKFPIFLYFLFCVLMFFCTILVPLGPMAILFV